MPINFNTLPGENPNRLPDKGRYIATISKAEMKPPKDPAKPKYLNLQLSLKTPTGRGVGSIFDKLIESDSEILRYKIQRFIVALNIPIIDTFELADLCKIIVGKQLIVDITHTTPKEGDTYPAQAVVDIFSGNIYYPINEAANLFDMPFEVIDSPEDIINAPDAADGQQTGTPTNSQKTIRY